MYLKIAAYKESKSSKLNVMIDGDINEVLNALCAMLVNINENIIKDLDETSKEEIREQYYSEIMRGLKHHEKSSFNNID